MWSVSLLFCFLRGLEWTEYLIWFRKICIFSNDYLYYLSPFIPYLGFYYLICQLKMVSVYSIQKMCFIFFLPFPVFPPIYLAIFLNSVRIFNRYILFFHLFAPPLL